PQFSEEAQGKHLTNRPACGAPRLPGFPRPRTGPAVIKFGTCADRKVQHETETLSYLRDDPCGRAVRRSLRRPRQSPLRAEHGFAKDDFVREAGHHSPSAPVAASGSTPAGPVPASPLNSPSSVWRLGTFFHIDVGILRPPRDRSSTPSTLKARSVSATHRAW